MRDALDLHEGDKLLFRVERSRAVLAKTPDFLSLAGTDGFVELPPGPNTYAKGFVTNMFRW